MEALHNLVEAEKYVREMSASEYFNAFYDHMDLNNLPWPNSVMTDRELTILRDVCHLMNVACAETPKNINEEELIATGWPIRIKPFAENALLLFLERGRFGEEVEESEPSFTAGQAWLELCNKS